MIVPDSFIRLIEKDPELGTAMMNFPLAFFGGTLDYPKQAAILRHWFKHQPKIAIITGWTRTGKTGVGVYIGSTWLNGKMDANWPGARHMGLTETQEWRTQAFAPLRTMLIGGSTMDHINEVLLNEYKDIVPPTLIKQWASKQHHAINLKGGRKAVIRSYDQALKEWKSGAYALVHLDEEPPLEVLKECLARTTTTRGKIVITVAVDDGDVSYLPDAVNNPIKYFGTDDVCHYQIGVEEVPTEIYPEEEKRSVYALYDNTPQRDAVRKGDFMHLAGKWWPEFDSALHVIDTFEIPEYWLKWRFLDVGTAAPTGCVWAALHPKGDIFIYREYYKANTLIETRCTDIIELSNNKRQLDNGVWKEIIPAKGGERYLSTQMDYHEFKINQSTGDTWDYEYIKNGLEVQRSTTLDQEARRNALRKWLKLDPRKRHWTTKKSPAPRLYIFSTCTNLIWEAQKKSLKREANSSAAVSERKVQNRDDHLMDACEYAAIEIENWVNLPPAHSEGC